MTKILGGKEIAQQIRTELAAGVAELRGKGGRTPGLTAVLVGDDAASQVYVASKTRGCEEVGMIGHTLRLPADISADDMRRTVDELNADDAVDGILIQLPLPKGLPERELLERIDPAKDVDGFHPENVGRLWLDQPGFVSATPAGVVELLHRNQIPLAGQHAVVIGRSNIVGKPMAGLLLREHCTVTVCHSRTRDLAAIARQADLLVAAIGRPGFIGAEHVRDGAVVIDVGMNRVSDRATAERLFSANPTKMASFESKGWGLAGDVDYERVRPIASAITPVPGGVGLLTVAMVLANTLQASRRRQGL